MHKRQRGYPPGNAAGPDFCRIQYCALLARQHGGRDDELRGLHGCDPLVTYLLCVCFIRFLFLVWLPALVFLYYPSRLCYPSLLVNRCAWVYCPPACQLLNV